MEHVAISAGEIHAPHNWEFADATARAAEVIADAALVGRIALQIDDGSYWRLTGAGPATWAAVKADPRTHSHDYEAPGAAAVAVAAHEGAADPHDKYALVNAAITDVSYTAGGTTTIELDGRVEHFTATAATGATTWAITGAPAGKSTGFILDLTNGGSQTQNWPAGSDFDGGIAPTLTADGKDRLVFQYDGSTWAIALAMADFK